MARSAGRTDEILTRAVQAVLRGDRVIIHCPTESEAHRVFAHTVRELEHGSLRPTVMWHRS